MTDPMREAANILCRSGKFETGEGTCALTCMDQLGDVRKKGCHHAIRIHGELARNIVEALSLLTTKASDDELVDHVANAMRNAVIRDDEGEFPRLFDLLDFSGENKAWTVTRGLARAAISSMPTIADEGER
jgi:hypothetical protein